MTESSHGIDPNTALIIELIAGFMGFLGLGYLLTGRTTEGILRLVGWWLFLAIGWVTISILTLCLIGIFLIPFMLIAQVAIPVLSAIYLKNQMEEEGS